VADEIARDFKPLQAFVSKFSDAQQVVSFVGESNPEAAQVPTPPHSKDERVDEVMSLPECLLGHQLFPIVAFVDDFQSLESELIPLDHQVEGFDVEVLRIEETEVRQRNGREEEGGGS
jgi:hypothetical protein